MEFIYDELRNGIFEVLVKEKNSLSYTKLYNTVNENREKKFSPRDFSNALKEMVKEGELTKEDTGKRGTKVYYSLTQQSKEKYRLEILGEGEKYEKRREIYHLLLYYDVFKRSNLMTKTQLDKLLKKAGIEWDEVNNIDDEQDKYLQKANTSLRDCGIENVKLLGCPKGIAIGELLINDGETKIKKVTRYCVVIPGFTVEEFVLYIDKLKKNKEPRPFTHNIPLIPYVYYTNYTKEEINESIKLLKEAEFLVLTSPIFNGEMRYVVSGDRLLGLFSLLTIIHSYLFELIIAKILHIIKPNEEDKEWLVYFFGEQESDKLIAKAYELRKAFLNDNQDVNKIKEKKKNIIELEEQKNLLIGYLNESYGDIIQSDPLLRDLVI